VEKAMSMSEPKLGDIISYKQYNKRYPEQYGIITKLPYGELMHVEWFEPANAELIGNKISIWGYGDIWNIVS
jgi:hypothetical protein